jgi:hypothetical protein
VRPNPPVSRFEALERLRFFDRPCCHGPRDLGPTIAAAVDDGVRGAWRRLFENHAAPAARTGERRNRLMCRSSEVMVHLQTSRHRSRVVFQIRNAAESSNSCAVHTLDPATSMSNSSRIQPADCLTAGDAFGQMAETDQRLGRFINKRRLADATFPAGLSRMAVSRDLLQPVDGRRHPSAMVWQGGFDRHGVRVDYRLIAGANHRCRPRLADQVQGEPKRRADRCGCFDCDRRPAGARP